MESPHLPDDHPPLPDDRYRDPDRPWVSTVVTRLAESGALTWRQACALLLNVGFGLGYREIAQGCGTTKSTIGRDIEVAEAVLRKIVGQHGYR